jgi:phosphoenolpyruvate synthase/pyruvate phosphate dikinase
MLERTLIIEETLCPGPSVEGAALVDKDGAGPRGIFVVRTLNIAQYRQVIESTAVICESGQATNHMTVVCRILGIPIVRIPHATHSLVHGEVVRIDLRQNQVVRGPFLQSPDESQLPPHQSLPPGIRFQVSIIDSADLISRVNSAGRHDVEQFFLRSELLWLAIGEHPYRHLRRFGRRATAQCLADHLGELCSRLEPNQILNFRGLDLRTDAAGFSQRRPPQEPNPQLGLHGVRALLSRREYLKTELDAVRVVMKRGQRNILYSVPFVALPSEVAEVLLLANEQAPEVPIGVFIETPGAVIEVDEILSQQPRSLYIGTKDLAQLTLGCDRDNSRVAYLLSAQHHAVTEQVAQVLAKAERQGVPAFVFALPADLPNLLRAVPATARVSLAASDYLNFTRAEPT